MNPVPRLDLAPKLTHPLSLWNPVDYLRLLYWVFYFPQAFRWYINTFAGGYIPLKEMTWSKRWDLLRQNPVRRNLLILGLIFTLLTQFYLSFGFYLGFRFHLSFGLDVDLLSIVFMITSGVLIWEAFDLGILLLLAIIFLIVVLLDWIVINWFTSTINSFLKILFGAIILGRLQNFISDILRSMAWGITRRFSQRKLELQLMWMVIIFITLGTAGGVVIGLKYGIAKEIWIAIAIILFILRPEAWFLSLPKRSYFHITPIPTPFLRSRLTNWLRRDWEVGLDNTRNLLSYTLQFIPIVRAISKVLIEIPNERIIFRLIQVIELPYGWDLIYCFSTFIIRYDCVFSDIPAHTAAAGFWYLHEKQPNKARQAFAVVRFLHYGEEMYVLAQTLATLQKAEEFLAISSLILPTFPQSNLLRPYTWQALQSLRLVVEDTQIIKNSASRAARAFALNRAIGEVTQIIDTQNTLPSAERELIVDIAASWKIALERLTKEVGQIAITKFVINPYIVGDPVEGEFFVGREDIMFQLEELCLRGHNIQSVVLFGHRRMGKTSILRNLSQRSRANVKVVYVNLLGLGDITQAEGEVLMALSDAISQTVNVAPPDDDDLLNLPYPTFRRFLQKVVETLHVTSQQETSQPGLIIALDEFEVIEELITAGKISLEFLGYLGSLVQMSPKIGFVLAGLHTFEEMIADYFQPLCASFTPPIKVSYMEAGATQVILANPGIDDFPLDYRSEALDKIYEFTHGQPFLVQLLGFQLVRSYNDSVFEMGQKRDPVFTVEDVEAVVNDAVFFERGRYYFAGVWEQAAQGVDGQQAVLRVLAPHPNGLNIDQICGLVGDLDKVTILAALKTLRSHDVAIENQGRWQIAVELFRRWVLLEGAKEIYFDSRSA